MSLFETQRIPIILNAQYVNTVFLCLKQCFEYYSIILCRL